MIKKIIITFYVFILFIPKTFAYENIVSFLVINGIDEREIEMVLDGDKIYLPCKYLLEYFEIPYVESHVNKSISLKNAVVSPKEFLVEGKKKNYKVFYVKEGIMGLKNEFYILAEAFKEVTGKKVSTDSNELLAFIVTDDFKEEDIKKNVFLTQDGKEPIKAYEEITLPVQKGFITVDSVAIKNNMMSDSYSQIYKDSQSSNASFNNSIQMNLKGKLGTGEYGLDMGTNSYTNNMLAFSGISPSYKNRYKDFDYVIGKFDDWEFGDTTVSSDTMGIQIKDHIEKKMGNYRHIDGKVDSKSTVKVYMNDDFEEELSTYGGYYTLKNIFYSKPLKKIRIEELLADGSSKEVFSQDFTKNKNNVPKRDFILGINGLQNRLWADNGYIYENTVKKIVGGLKYNKRISEKLTFDTFAIADKIYGGANGNEWCQSILGNRNYLNYTTMKNINALDGETLMGALTYDHNPRMKSKMFFGGSASKSTDGYTEDGIGYYLKYENDFEVNKDTSLTSSLFASSPGFYLAGSGSGGGFISDRVGGSLTASTTYKKLSFSGTYSKYKSNFGDFYEGGLLDFDEYRFFTRLAMSKLPSVSLKVNNKRGMNNIGEISSNMFELSADKRIKCVRFNGGIRKNNYSNEYTAADFSSYSSDYSDIYTDIYFPLGKRFGNASVGHNIVNTKSDTIENDYKSINLKYATPMMKGFSLNVGVGYHYAGTNKGEDFGLGITKRLKSGSTVSLNYRYSQIPFYMVDNMYIPASMRHSVTINFSELYGIGGKGLEAVGTSNKNKGYIQACSFLDVNQNGIKDKGEPNIPEIPIKLAKSDKPVFTNKKGLTKLMPQDEGVYKLEIFEDELPTFLSCHNKTKPKRYIKVKNNSKTKVDFGLISSIGNVDGSITIKDEFDNILRLDDIVVSVIDLDGKEVNYTNINSDGTFSFSGLTPGKYVVEIDKEIQDLYRIKPEKDSINYTIEIPAKYDDYVNIDNVNLDYSYEL